MVVKIKHSGRRITKFLNNISRKAVGIKGSITDAFNELLDNLEFFEGSLDLGNFINISILFRTGNWRLGKVFLLPMMLFILWYIIQTAWIRPLSISTVVKFILFSCI